MQAVSRGAPRFALLALATALAAAPVLALASDDCDVPIERWQSRDAVRQMAAARDWQIERLKIDDGCYEIRGRDGSGRSFKAKLDPETLRIVKMKRRAHTREHKRDRQESGSRGSDSARRWPDSRSWEQGQDPDRPERVRQARDVAPAAPASGATTPLTPGTAPRGRID